MSSKEKSTKDKIKDMFLEGKVLTSCGASQDFLTADLRKYISDLRREGMKIIDKVITNKTKKRYKEYWLETEADRIAAAAAAKALELKQAAVTIPEVVIPVIEVADPVVPKCVCAPKPSSPPLIFQQSLFQQ